MRLAIVAAAVLIAAVFASPGGVSARDDGQTRDTVSAAPASSRLAWRPALRRIAPLAVSPDGRSIVYVDYDQAGDLFLHDLATGADRRLTVAKGSEVANDDGTAFSNDGTQLAYGWSNAEGFDELRVVDLRGSGIPAPRRLLVDKGITYLGPLGWSLDGQWIAALVDRSPPNQVVLISTKDASLRVIKSANIQTFNIGWGFVSPDGKYIAIDGNGTGTQGRDIFALDLESGRETPIVVSRGNDRLLGWSGDGTRLLFMSDRTGTNALFTVPLNDGKPQGEPTLMKADVGRLLPVGVTTSGGFYYSSTYRGNSDVATGSFDFRTGATVSTATDLPLNNFAASHRSPEWSPDGRNLAYIVERGPGAGESSIAIRSLATDQVQEIRPQLDRVEWLRWSPDGKSFVVSARNLIGPANWRIDPAGLWRVDLTTGALSPIVMGTFAARPQDAPGTGNRFHGWSSDGTRIYLQRTLAIEAGIVLLERDLVSGQERELFRQVGPGPYYSVSLSPDRRKLYYRKGLGIATDPSSAQSAFIERDLTTRAEKELLRGRLGFPSLSPDGRHIATSLFDHSTRTRSIVIVPSIGGASRVLMRTALPTAFSESNWQNMQSLLWAPDSHALMFGALDQPLERAPWAYWLASVDGRGAPRRVSVGGNLWDIRVHSDGRRFALAVAHPPATSEVWVLQVSPKAGSQ